MQRRWLGGWPVHYIPGNHDVAPGGGGLRLWREVLGNSTPVWAAPRLHSVNYRALRRAGWRLLLLDSMDGAPPAPAIRHHPVASSRPAPTVLPCRAQA